MKLMKEQIEAAVGLFQRMNAQQLDVDPAVFTMFGLLLGAAKAAEIAAEEVQNGRRVFVSEVGLRRVFRGWNSVAADYIAPRVWHEGTLDDEGLVLLPHVGVNVAIEMLKPHEIIRLEPNADAVAAETTTAR